jgi:pimeloyl-ACP methyl ester carboxylesterase
MNATTDRSLPVPVARIAHDLTRPARKAKGLRVLRALIVTAVGVVALIAAAAAVGTTYEAIAASGDHLAYPPSGRLVDVGGYRLHLDCRGQGSPTVVMDAGLGGSSLDWSLVQPDVAETTRVCTYDRAGMGWSDVGPMPRSPAHLAEELHTLLANAGIDGPLVLVAHSLAGKNVRMFAAAYPDQVAGMVLVDARSEHVDALVPKAEADAFRAALQMQGALYSIERRIGLARALAVSLIGEDLIPPATATQMVLLQTQPNAIDETTAEGMARTADDPALAGFTLGSMPLVVIAAAASLRDLPNWQMAQEQMAKLSTDGRLVVAAHSGHFVHAEEPAIVSAAIADVVSNVRADH